MIHAMRTELHESSAEALTFSAQRTMYGGKHIVAGDVIFPETELNFKFYRQATEKIVGISDETAKFLRGFFGVRPGGAPDPAAGAVTP